MSQRTAISTLAIISIVISVLGIIAIVFYVIVLAAMGAFGWIWILHLSGLLLLISYAAQIVAAVGMFWRLKWAWRLGVIAVAVRTGLEILVALVGMGMPFLGYAPFLLIELLLVWAFFRPKIRLAFND